MSASDSNVVLRQLRETAALLRKPQAQVAANWLRQPAMTTYDEDRNIGVTAEEFDYGMRMLRRLVRVLEASNASGHR
jgi:hypothetical protein